MLGLRYLENVTTLKLDSEKCTGCRMCTIVCPHGVFIVEDKKAIIQDLNACMECSACALNCPEDALSVRSGVGCAAGVINGFFRGTGEACC